MLSNQYWKNVCAPPRPGAKERAILSLKVCDLASGSGHFLLAAARRLGKELARVTTGEDEPSPERVREAIREVITHCIYGVDEPARRRTLPRRSLARRPRGRQAANFSRPPHPLR